MKKNEDKKATLEFFWDVFPEIVLSDRYKDSVVLGMLDEGSQYLWGLLKAYAKREAFEIPYNEDDFKIEFNFEDFEKAKFIRITLPEELHVLRIYIAQEIDAELNITNQRMYYSIFFDDVHTLAVVGKDLHWDKCYEGSKLDETDEDAIVIDNYMEFFNY